MVATVGGGRNGRARADTVRDGEDHAAGCGELGARRLRKGGSLQRRSCLAFAAGGLASSPDGIVYIAPTREVWATVGAPPLGIRPADQSIVVLDASNPSVLEPKGRIEVGGAAEGYAVDASRGIFYTNLEDRNRTLAIDVRTRRVTATWDPGCGPEGPRGLAVDTARNFLFVACTDRVVALDAGRGGARLGALETGGGVDNIDYLESRQQLFVAAAKTATLSVIRVGEGGELSVTATGETARSARVVVADAGGRAYVADPAGGRLLVFDPAPLRVDQEAGTGRSAAVGGGALGIASRPWKAPSRLASEKN